MLVCCNEVREEVEVEVSQVGDLEEGKILINWTEDFVEKEVTVQWIEDWNEEEEIENGGWSCDVEIVEEE